jgi:hypothetical protein
MALGVVCASAVSDVRKNRIRKPAAIASGRVAKRLLARLEAATVPFARGELED